MTTVSEGFGRKKARFGFLVRYTHSTNRQCQRPVPCTLSGADQLPTIYGCLVLSFSNLRSTHVRTVFPTPGPPMQSRSCGADSILVQSTSSWLFKNHSPVPGDRLAWTSLCFCRLVTGASHSSISVVLRSRGTNTYDQHSTIEVISFVPCSLSSAIRIPCEISHTSVAVS